MNKKDAIKLFKNSSDLARQLGISKQAVSRWRDKIPPLRAYQIKEIIKNDDIE